MVRDVVLFPRNTFYSLYGSQIVKSVPDFPCFTFLQVTFAFQAGFSEVLSCLATNGDEVVPVKDRRTEGPQMPASDLRS